MTIKKTPTENDDVCVLMPLATSKKPKETLGIDLDITVRHESASPLVAESATGKARPSAFRI
jgi:hypothetical protein